MMYMLNNTATLQEYTETTNDLGEIVESWADVETIDARISQLSADERYQSNRYTGVVEWRLYADYSNVTTDIGRANYRVLIDGHTYKIESVNNVDKMDRLYQIDLLRTD